MMEIPAATLQRLPRYYRCLRTLLISDVLRVSSTELAEKLNITASQVRSDLSYIGTIGQQGYGYGVKQLYTSLSRKMGVGDGMRAIVISDRYCPLMSRSLFDGRGVELCGIFCEEEEQPPSAADTREESVQVLPIAAVLPFCTENKPEIAVLLPCRVPAQTLAEKLMKCGVSGIWNFTQNEIKLPIPVRNVLLSDALMTLCFEIHRQMEKE